MLRPRKLTICYGQQTKLREGNVFTGVCLFTWSLWCQVPSGNGNVWRYFQGGMSRWEGEYVQGLGMSKGGYQPNPSRYGTSGGEYQNHLFEIGHHEMRLASSSTYLCNRATPLTVLFTKPSAPYLPAYRGQERPPEAVPPLTASQMEQ